MSVEENYDEYEHYIIDSSEGYLDDDEDDDDYWLSECGKQPDGSCLLAGSEECDFECPYRDEDEDDE